MGRGNGFNVNIAGCGQKPGSSLPGFHERTSQSTSNG
jgi:hypothetical protein